MKNLPEACPFSFEISYQGGFVDTPLTEKDFQILEKIDPYCREREACRLFMYNKILGPFFVFKSKYGIQKCVFTSHERAIKNELLFNILEDSTRQNVTDFYDIAKDFSKFLDKCKGGYSKLFNKKSQDKFVSHEISLDKSKKEDLLRVSKEIDEKREKIFSKFNNSGCPTNESFDDLNEKVKKLYKRVQDYRDKVCAHNDETEIDFCWIELDSVVNEFEEIIFDFYQVMCFSKRFSATVKYCGKDILQKETKNILIRHIYKVIK